MKTRPAKPYGNGVFVPASGIRAVFLVGFMGAGKTSVGRALSEILGWKFEDLDERIQSLEKRSVAQIFTDAGEAGFRTAERNALKTALKDLRSSGMVMALGGGAFVSPENLAMLSEPGLVTIFLDAPVEELFRRCEQQNLERPLQRGFEEFCKLHAQRQDAYRQATLRIETCGKPVQEIANRIAAILASA